eukprot:22759_1
MAAVEEPNEETLLKVDMEEEEEEKNVVREGSVDLDELYKNELWYLSSTDIGNYHEFFMEADLNKDGFISGYEANAYFKEAILNRKQLSDIWSLCDHKRNGKISEAMFYVMFHIFYTISQSEGAIPIPHALPECLQYEAVEKLRLTWKLRQSQSDEQQRAQVLLDMKAFKEEQEEKKRQIRNVMRNANQNAVNRARVLSKEEIKENKRQILANQYPFGEMKWRFNDELGHPQGPYNIHTLIECWRNSELLYSSSLWRDNNRSKNEKLHDHKALYDYIRLFSEYQWYYSTDGMRTTHGPYYSSGMKRFVESGTIGNETQIRRVPPFAAAGDSQNVFKMLGNTDVNDAWSKSITKIDHENEGYLIQDTATMFLYNLCHYFFGVSIWFDARESGHDTLHLLAVIACVMCVFESVAISLGQFELQEGFIPFTNVLIPIAVIQLILEWMVHLPMVILQIYYLYCVKWSSELEMNSAVYVCFAGYLLHSMYKGGVIGMHHFDEFQDSSLAYGSEERKKVRRCYECCRIGHLVNWAMCVPIVCIVFGSVYLKNDQNDFVLSLVLLILGSLVCCCGCCAGAVAKFC